MIIEIKLAWGKAGGWFGAETLKVLCTAAPITHRFSGLGGKATAGIPGVARVEQCHTLKDNSHLLILSDMKGNQ